MMDRPTRNCYRVCIQVAVELLEPLKECFDKDEEMDFLDNLAEGLAKSDDAFEIGVVMHNCGSYISEFFVIDLVKADVYKVRKRVHEELLQWWLLTQKPCHKIGDIFQKPFFGSYNRYNVLTNRHVVREINYQQGKYVFEDKTQVDWELANTWTMVL